MPATLVTIESRFTPVPVQIFYNNVQTALITAFGFGVLLFLYGGTMILIVLIEQPVSGTATDAAIAATSLCLLRLGAFGRYLASGSFDGADLAGETKRVLSYLFVFHFALILAVVLLAAVEFIAIAVLVGIKLAVELYMFRELSTSGNSNDDSEWMDDDSDWTGDDSDWTDDDSDWTGDDSDWTDDDSDWTGDEWNSTSDETGSTGEETDSAPDGTDSTDEGYTWNPAPTDPVTWYPIDRRIVALVAASNAIAVLSVLVAGWSIGIVFALFLFEFTAACGFTIARVYAEASPKSENRFLSDRIVRGMFLGKMVAVAGVFVGVGVGITVLSLSSDPKLVTNPTVVATVSLACACSFAGYTLAAPIDDPSVPEDWEELPNPFVTLLAVVPAIIMIAIIWFLQLPTGAIAGAVVLKAVFECNEYCWAHDSVVRQNGNDSPGTAE